MTTISRRDPFWDLLKAWAIYLVIWQHMISCLGEGMNMWNTPVGKAITMFNMPLFVFIVGYFSTSTYTRPFKVVLQQKWVSLIRPMLVFCCVMLIINLSPPISVAENFSWQQCLIKYGKIIYSTIFNSYWFIWTIIIYIFWTYLIKFLCKKTTFALTITVALLSFYLLPTTPLYNFATNKALYPFFILGLVCRTENWMRVFDRYRGVLSVTSLIIFIILYIAYDSHQFFYYFASLPFAEVIRGYLMLFPAGISGIILSIALMKIIAKFDNPLTRFLIKYGQYTFFIYMAQQVIVNATGLFDLQIHAWYVHILIAIVVFSIICISVPLIRRSRLLSVALMGK